MSEKDQEFLRRSRGVGVEPLPTEEVVYGVHDLGLVLFAERRAIEHLSRQCWVFNECATWGRRPGLPPAEGGDPAGLGVRGWRGVRLHHPLGRTR